MHGTGEYNTSKKDIDKTSRFMAFVWKKSRGMSGNSKVRMITKSDLELLMAKRDVPFTLKDVDEYHLANGGRFHGGMRGSNYELKPGNAERYLVSVSDWDNTLGEERRMHSFREFLAESSPAVNFWSKRTKWNGIEMSLIGTWQDLAGYYEGSDGNAWKATRSNWTNEGPVNEFKARFAKKYRGNLFESYIHPNAWVLYHVSPTKDGKRIIVDFPDQLTKKTTTEIMRAKKFGSAGEAADYRSEWSFDGADDFAINTVKFVQQMIRDANDTSLQESAPPDSDIETWITKNKQRFKDEYGADYEQYLYGKAWTMYNKKQGLSEAATRDVKNPSYGYGITKADILPVGLGGHAIPISTSDKDNPIPMGSRVSWVQEPIEGGTVGYYRVAFPAENWDKAMKPTAYKFQPPSKKTIYLRLPYDTFSVFVEVE